MRDLSLHILDLIENSIRANATLISVTIAEYPETDELKIVVEDNGYGLDVPAKLATDPFYSTHGGKHTGLGLSLLQAAVERAGGKLKMSKSRLGGLAVEASMQLSHIDRTPLGDVAATLSSVVCTNPGVDLWCRFCVGNRECTVKASEVVKELPVGQRRGLAVARRLSEEIKAHLEGMEVVQ